MFVVDYNIYYYNIIKNKWSQYDLFNKILGQQIKSNVWLGGIFAKEEMLVTTFVI
jgi:hypothetical protein